MDSYKNLTFIKRTFSSKVPHMTFMGYHQLLDEASLFIKAKLVINANLLGGKGL